MLKPAVEDIITKEQSKYSLVIAVAKRAREISDDAIRSENILIEKPVKLAVKDLAKKKYRIIEDLSNKEKF